jgi:ATP-binding cassette, subfamily B, multidrug efflux pump
VIGLLRTYLAPYRGRLAVVVALLLVQAIGNLYLPDLNGDIINNGVVLGDLDHILRVGLLMLVITGLVGVAAIASVYLSAEVANGFARDVRSAVFAKVETFGQVEVNRSDPHR